MQKCPDKIKKNNLNERKLSLNMLLDNTDNMIPKISNDA